MTPKSSLDVLAVIVAPLEMYPPSLYQVELMAEAGLSVGVIDRYHADYEPAAFKGQRPVLRIRPCRHTLSYKELFPALPIRMWERVRFQGSLIKAIHRYKPKVIIAYDDFACHMLGNALVGMRPPRIICHFHELSHYAYGDGAGAWAAYKYSRRFARDADLVVFPDAHRAAVFAAQAKLKKMPAVVMNCPRRMEDLPANKLRFNHEKLQNSALRVIYFHGVIEANRGIEETVHSMKDWSPDSVFVLVGPGREAYKKSLSALGKALGVDLRILFVDPVPLSELASLTVGAEIACALFPEKTDNLNFRFLAGASNKRFQYMAAGVPQITNHGPGMKEIIDKPLCGLLVDPKSPTQIGEAAARLLNDHSLRAYLATNARKAHLERFNYEHQFAGVLSRIFDWTT